MTKKKEISKDAFISAATDMLKGKSIRQTTKDYQMSERDARWLSRNQGLNEKEFQKLVIRKSQVILEEALDMVREKLPLIPPGQLAITYGILADKLQKITETQNHNLTIQNTKIGIEISGKILSREELIELIKPKNKDPGSKRKPPRSKEPNNIIDC